MKSHATALLLAILAGPVGAQSLSPEEGQAALGELADAARESRAAMDFASFKEQTLYLPETGKFYVNGDTPIRNEKLLREFWMQNVRALPRPSDGPVPEFTVINVGGLDQIWDAGTRKALTFCVSTEFGPRHPLVVGDMLAAAASWEAVADLDFIYLPAEDGHCTQTNSNVLFDVRPVDAGGDFLAAAFFPNDPRSDRSVVIDPSSFALDPNDNLTLRGVLRHELGHVIGGRHEHTRPDAGACFEDSDWRGVTDYDAFSVMHYPQCNGRGDWSLTLTDQDKSGVACLYGPAAGFQIDPTVCTPPNQVSSLQDFGPFDLAQGALQMVWQGPVMAGEPFRAEMTGTGDPDLYVKFDGAALVSSYDCRPYNTGADEVCEFDVPEGKTLVSVAVHGYEAATFNVVIDTPQP